MYWNSLDGVAELVERAAEIAEGERGGRPLPVRKGPWRRGRSSWPACRRATRATAGSGRRQRQPLQVLAKDQGGIAGLIDILQRRHEQGVALAAAGRAAEERFEAVELEELALRGMRVVWAVGDAAWRAFDAFGWRAGGDKLCSASEGVCWFRMNGARLYLRRPTHGLVPARDRTNSNDATARPVEQRMLRPASAGACCRFSSGRGIVHRGEREQWARIAGWLAVIVTRLPLAVRGRRPFRPGAAAMPRPWNSGSDDQPRDAFGFLPAERGDDGAEGDGREEFGLSGIGIADSECCCIRNPKSPNFATSSGQNAA